MACGVFGIGVVVNLVDNKDQTGIARASGYVRSSGIPASHPLLLSFLM